MRRSLFTLSALLALTFALSACATPVKKVETGMLAAPEPAEGEVAVFGKVRLIEFVARMPMPTEEQDASIYLKQEYPGKTYKVKCSASGDFGVYLPAGSYMVTRIKADGYTFEPESLLLYVPKGYKSIYAGTVVLDGTPSGVVPGTKETRFVFSVKDEYKEFSAMVRHAAPDADLQVVKSLFKPGDAVATGSYPVKVHRAEDVEKDLGARSAALEEVVEGGLVALPYVINPLWLFTTH